MLIRFRDLLLLSTYLIFTTHLSHADFLEELKKRILLSAVDPTTTVDLFSVEQCSIQFETHAYCTYGACRPFSIQWHETLKETGPSEIICNTVNEEVIMQNYKTDTGYQDFAHFHYFNLITSLDNPETKFIVDSTYLQFFSHPQDLKLSPIFIGTQNDLIVLIKKFRKHLMVENTLHDHKAFPLAEDEVERFVKFNWPIQSHEIDHQ